MGRWSSQYFASRLAPAPRLLGVALLFGLAFVPLACGQASGRPLNVVLLYADDWRHDTLACAGNPVVKTPRLDDMAARGVRFTRNYATTSICGVSRATLLTGQWMSRHGNRAFDMFQTPWEETFPGQLRKRGYHLGHVGKWHCGKPPAERFDFFREYSGTHWTRLADGSRIHVTERNEQDALEFLRDRPAGKPFCLCLSFFATHAEDGNPKQYLPRPESMTLYQDVTVPIPRTATDEHFRRLPPFLADEKNEGRRRWRWRFDTPEKYQESMKNYYRLATEVDGACGRVLDELERQSLLGETLVIFTTDNGYFHGEHGLADKWYPYEESIRVPLLVLDPRAPASRRGATCGAMTLNVDLAPTILAAAGIAAPQGMQGTNLAPLIAQSDAPAARDEFFYEHGVIKAKDVIPASQALVRRDWKYILWPDFGVEQLFHLEDDPYEERDLAAEGVHAERLGAMRRRFAELKLQAQ